MSLFKLLKLTNKFFYFIYFCYFLLNCFIFKEAGELVDIQNIKHIVEDKKPVVDLMEKIAKDWKI